MNERALGFALALGSLLLALPACHGSVDHPGASDDGGLPPGADADPAAPDAAPPGSQPDGAPAEPTVRVVAYLPNYSGSYGDWAGRIDFSKMTHLNLAFAKPDGNNHWDMGASDDDVHALVEAAHAHGVKVLPSLGGGGGDQAVIARYRDAGNIPNLVAQLGDFVSRFGFDGVDIDIEDGGQLGANYTRFVDQTTELLRPQGKLVTAAVAQYLQDGMSDDTLHEFDFVNVMIYTTYDDSVNELAWYKDTKGMAPTDLTLGAAFFGTDSTGREYGFNEIMDADGSAWQRDNTTVNGRNVHYTGVDSMKQLADFSKSYGGIMFWELSEDVSGEHSLWKAIQDTM
jgi:chitinase